MSFGNAEKCENFESGFVCEPPKMGFASGNGCDKIDTEEMRKSCHEAGQNNRGECMDSSVDDIDLDDYVVAYKNGDTSRICTVEELAQKKEDRESGRLVAPAITAGLSLADISEFGQESKLYKSLCEGSAGLDDEKQRVKKSSFSADECGAKCLLALSLNEKNSPKWNEGEWALFLLKNFRSFSARVKYINGMIDRFERQSVSQSYVARYGSLEQFFDIVLDLIQRKKMIIDAQLFAKRLVQELSEKEKLVLKYFITRDKKVLDKLLTKMSRRTVYRLADKVMAKMTAFMKARGYTAQWCFENFDAIIHAGI